MPFFDWDLGLFDAFYQLESKVAAQD